jgi:cysteine desulfurase
LLRDRVQREILARVDDSHVIGATHDTKARLPNTTNIGFARLEAEAILLLLSEKGVCASAGAACSSGSLEPSHVLRAMGIPEQIAHGAIRFSLSRYTTDAEIDRCLEILPPVIQRLRAVLPVS